MNVTYFNYNFFKQQCDYCSKLLNYNIRSFIKLNVKVNKETMKI